MKMIKKNTMFFNKLMIITLKTSWKMTMKMIKMRKKKMRLIKINKINKIHTVNTLKTKLIELPKKKVGPFQQSLKQIHQRKSLQKYNK